MNAKSRKLIDDLDIGERVRVDHSDGNTLRLETGRYEGLIRNNMGRWFLKLVKSKDRYSLVGTSDIEKIERV
jgi:hypothetical protein